MPEPSDIHKRAAVQSKGPILIVDDDPEYAAMLMDTLNSWKLPNAISIFADGKQLLNYLSRNEGIKPGTDAYPSLIILDLKMPTADGITVMNWLKNAGHTDVPIIIVSGSQDFKSIATTYEMGAYCFISKPQRPGDLEKIRHALRIW
jgi:DNA-binding response OmpR family regulator